MDKQITLARTKIGLRCDLLDVASGKRVPTSLEMTDGQWMTVVSLLLRDWKERKTPLPPKLQPYARSKGVIRRQKT
jgi:hypothetical protein